MDTYFALPLYLSTFIDHIFPLVDVIHTYTYGQVHLDTLT